MKVFRKDVKDKKTMVIFRQILTQKQHLKITKNLLKSVMLQHVLSKKIMVLYNILISFQKSFFCIIFKL